MALSAGVRIGSYEIVSILGIGGMGEVYRARDLKLGRDVALKVLPTSLAGDPERFSRFQREARVLASLNHPHIAAIYGVEESGGVPALVMELVDGHTLAERIAQDPPSLLEACTLAMQIAEAIEAAHDAGIIHRDLKPANIKVRGDGTVKVLDFGLGKSLGPTNGHDGAGETATDSPYGLAQHPTQPGLVLGTPAYMAPEQARGKPVDKRADIWAFGCVFYEVLTGRRLFDGATASDTLAAVLTGDIDLDRVPAPLPPRVRQLLARCLDRDPRTRLRDIGEARVALQGLDEPLAEQAPHAGHRIGGRLMWALTIGLTVACMVIAVLWQRGSRQHPAAPPYRFTIATPTMFDLADFAVSPDGRSLAFVALADSKRPAVWIRAFADADGKVLPGTEGARWVFWSSDSQSIGFTSNHQIHRQSIQGGAPRIVARFSGQFIGATWSGDTIVFASFPGGLMRVPVDGGTPTALTNLRTGDQLHGAPAFLPGGRRVLFPAYTDSSPQICAVSLDDPAVQCAETVASLVAYVDRRRLLMLRDGLLAFHPFDVGALRSEGEPTAALDERILLRAAGNRAAVSYSPPGVIAFRPGSPEQRRLVWFDRAGRRGKTVAVGSHDNFDLASDGTRILVAGTDDAGNDRVSVIDTTRSVVSRVVAGERGWANDPVWSPHGREFAYLQRTDRSRIVVRPVDGGPERTVYESTDADVWVEDWSRDGRYIAIGSSSGWRHPRALIVPAAGGPPIPVAVEGTIVDEYHFSPDGRWLAYNSDASGQQEVYVTRLPPTGERWQLSPSGGVQARWRADGQELFYIAADGAMMAVTIQGGHELKLSAPQRLFTLPEGLGSPILDEYAVTADGQAFLIAERIRSRGVQPISVIVNWPPSDR
jgi:eukaryotic-like serine/threonine-protein kinase